MGAKEDKAENNKETTITTINVVNSDGSLIAELPIHIAKPKDRLLVENIDFNAFDKDGLLNHIQRLLAEAKDRNGDLRELEAKIQELQHANFALGTENTILNDKFKGNTLLPTDQFNQLIEMITEYKNDIIPLVSVFGIITQFIGEEASMLKITMMLPGLLKNKQIVNQIEAIIPIVKKYTQAPENNGE